MSFANFDELEARIESAPWFARLGVPIESAPCPIEQVAGLHSLMSELTIAGRVTPLDREMEWLPTTADMPDPIHGDAVEARAKELGVFEGTRARRLAIHKRVLAKLRDLDSNVGLKVAPHDFTVAATGGACYAARRASLELALGAPGFWCDIMTLFAEGHWPCGLLPDHIVVVI